MSAQNTDKLIKLSRRWVSQIGSGGVADAEATTIPLSSSTNLPTDTAVIAVIDRVDVNGNATPTLEETVVGVVSSTNLINCTRGVEGTAQAHSAGAVVEVLFTAAGWNKMVDWGLVQHGQDGIHSSALVTSLKATGTTVNTGTDDATIVTPKALADSNVSFTDGTETLTNKTLTSPKINEDVALTATATQLNSQVLATNDGWISANETWTYASASTITVPSGAASKYSKGDKIKLTQTTVKYFYIIGVADTVLTVTGGSGYTVADAAISANYYSHSQSPLGFPVISFSPTVTWTAGTAPTGEAKTACFSINNGQCTAIYDINYTVSFGTTVTGVTLTLPIACLLGASASVSLAQDATDRPVTSAFISPFELTKVQVICSSASVNRLFCSVTYKCF